jgi:shikimate dehydrogenase
MPKVFILPDLDSWPHGGTSLAVLGHPIAHSLSPEMHNAALAELARGDAAFQDWKYHRFDIPPDMLPVALAAFHARKFRGLNLTVPHKVIAFEAINEVDAAAKPVGAVNTLLRTAGGWHGFNTDGYGLSEGIRESLGQGLGGRDIILLGAGGAARGAAVECLARGCASLAIGNRTPQNLEALLARIRPLAGGIALRGFSPIDPPSDLPAGALVINATSAGLKPGDPAPVDLGRLRRPAGVYDMIYNPPETGLLAQARALGIPAANGLGMLVHQGAKALEIWTGAAASKTAPVMRAAVSGAMWAPIPPRDRAPT